MSLLFIYLLQTLLEDPDLDVHVLGVSADAADSGESLVQIVEEAEVGEATVEVAAAHKVDRLTHHLA